ncbi:MAG: hypothetical protein QNJ08_10650, partial [Crocosphaera sp.]|nr:hypothetical protein [Crocosphaera sp.]
PIVAVFSLQSRSFFLIQYGCNLLITGVVVLFSKPYLYIINAQTGEIIDSQTRRYGRSLSYEFDVEEETDYLVLLTSRYNRQTGQYTLAVQS